MDALMIAKIPWTESEELRYLFSCLSASPNSHNTYVRMLQTKIDSQNASFEGIIQEGPCNTDIAQRPVMKVEV